MESTDARLPTSRHVGRSSDTVIMSAPGAVRSSRRRHSRMHSLSHRVPADGRTALMVALFLCGAAGPASAQEHPSVRGYWFSAERPGADSGVRGWSGSVAMVLRVSKAAAVGLAGSAW